MKYGILIFGIFLGLAAGAVDKPKKRSPQQVIGNIKKPKYNLKSKDILGSYGIYKGCEDIDNGGKPCAVAEVKLHKGRVFLFFNTMSVQVPLTEEKGRLVFEWTNSPDTECDDPGCSILMSVSGSISPKKQKGQYIPKLNVSILEDYPYPETEDDPEGEVTAVQTHNKRFD